MLRVEAILGNISQAAMAERIHHISHHGHVDFVTISAEDLDRHRLVARTDTGAEVAIALPRDQKLADGAVLLADDDKAIVVRAGEQRWLRLSPRNTEDALELGYHAGNLHWRVRFSGTDLLVAQNGPTGNYTDRIAPMIAAGRVSLVEAGQ
ncbi:urease accessory protein UreE [Mesorhizobium sp. YR577]|uniref:urease accessory protein UreE n=1 Tax=Mesorhizobium sp. YR577 TaxID=1884373 RepID=UPI0008F425B2|nr:urease accessory protein UreE [Mesorhizobium sp. YR577]SFU18944.1 urease accessory protein [Mesorhizobium sp. YR577]